MPRERGIGGKNRRKGKSYRKQDTSVPEADGDRLFYAYAIKLYGQSVEVIRVGKDDDPEPVRAQIRGKFWKRCWIKPGCLVLIERREFENAFDVVHRYQDKDIRQLLQSGLIIATGRFAPGGEEEDSDEAFAFDGVGGEGSEEEEEDEIQGQNRTYSLPPSESEEEIDLNDL